MQSSLIDQISSKPRGAIFSAGDFLSFGKRNSIDQALLRLAKKGLIQKLATGLYCKPKKDVILGDLIPNLHDVVSAYSHKFGYQIQLSPAAAANSLGLSQQVPARHVYLTDGPNRSLILGGIPITLKHVCPRKLLGIGTKAGLIIQALYYFGDSQLDKSTVLKIKKLIDSKDQKLLVKWLPLLPGWMRVLFLRDILSV